MSALVMCVLCAACPEVAQPTTPGTPEAPNDPGTHVDVAGRTLALEPAGSGGAGGAETTPSSGTGNGSSTTSPSSPAVGTAPTPRWVLRDAKGTPVKAWVSVSSYAASASARFPDMPTAVSVTYAGQRYIGLNYTLETGAVIADNGCMAADWRGLQVQPHSPCTILFSDAACTNAKLAQGSGTFVIGGKAYYATTKTESLTPAYVWNNGACAEVSIHAGVPLVAVPDDIAGLLGNAPYSLELVY